MRFVEIVQRTIYQKHHEHDALYKLHVTMHVQKQQITYFFAEKKDGKNNLIYIYMSFQVILKCSTPTTQTKTVDNDDL